MNQTLKSTAAALFAIQLTGCAVNTNNDLETIDTKQATEFAKKQTEKAKEGLSNLYDKFAGKTKEQQIKSVAADTGKTIEEIRAADAACPEGQKIDAVNVGSIINRSYEAQCVDGEHYTPKQP